MLGEVLALWLAGPIEHVGSTRVPGLPAKPMRSDAATRESYLRLKLTLASEFRDDREAYTAAKTPFIEAVLVALRRGWSGDP